MKSERGDMKKFGMVVEGGGMKCVYEAGVMDGFLDEGIRFDYGVGVSAGSSTMVTYFAEQYHRSYRFYVDHIDDPMYFGFKSFLKTRNLFGLQYIYGDITNSDGKDPLDFDYLMEQPADFHIVATDAETGKPTYFHKSEMRKDDYREIMASCAIPIISKPIELNGHYYYDGGLSDAIPALKAIDEGCDKIVILLSKPVNFDRKPERFARGMSALLHKYPKAAECLRNRHIMYKQQQNLIRDLEHRGMAFIFAPSDQLELNTYSMDKKANDELYNQGYKDFYDRLDEFKEFMEL